ncbi:fibulin-2-like isoform X2 [Pristis pectinata]|uniref:fibulin-2-like isoform X2 n=1 Tax=Pristis pectinata TaxID=685728 RepID=UPI00223C9FDF|nr:fibulin-2-like isoform X2 [Pristis pectinata]
MAAHSVGILLCAALALSVAPPGPDCTGVVCDELHDCIEETLEPGACCAHCLRRGCVCRGYEYYDCLQAGFQQGRVPGGTSYHVDSGSTVCRCPEDGGQISCSFIPCPKLPDNCAQVFRPRRGCPQCARLGCLSGGLLRPAGHSFSPQPCILCRCLPTGDLSCSPQPGCRPRESGDGAGGVLNDQRHSGAEEEAAGGLPETLTSCCNVGRRWASKDGICLREMALQADSRLCGELQEQCCLSALEEIRCRAGVEAAQSGDPCLLDEKEGCGSDPFKRCCRCCSLGLRSAASGLECNRTPELGAACSRVFSACCLRGLDPPSSRDRGTSHPPLSGDRAASRPPSSGDRGPSHPPSSGNRREARRPQEEVSAEADRGGDVGRESPLPGRGDVCEGQSRCSQLCTPLGLSYACSCLPGYQLLADGTSCEDVDECRADSHRCSAEQVCRNVPGSYRCDCRPGYQSHPFTRTCVDINECQQYMGRVCAQHCRNTLGTYQCDCSVGYRLAADNRSCEDVDECQGSPCSQDCVNVPGSFQCHCRRGYTLSPTDRTTCLDVDECSLTTLPLCAYRCINTLGSFSCTCPDEGYVLSPNRRNCKDLDECTLGTHNCTAAETCFNIQGGYKCLSFECPANYRRVGQTRCERVSCRDYVECQMVPQRITYYQLSLPVNVRIPANIFRISPSPVYVGDNILLAITKGNEAMFFNTRRLNNYTGFVYLQVPPREPRQFLLDVEMTLIRQGTATKFVARIYVFITGPPL